MTQISSYFASLGVAVDKNSFAQADKYFDRLEQRLLRFGKTSNAFKVPIRFTVDTARSQLQIQKALSQISKTLTLKINRFSLNNKALTNLLNQTLSTRAGAPRIRINAALSNASLTNMRTQVLSALNGIVISPRVAPRMTNPTGGSGGGVGGNRNSLGGKAGGLFNIHSPLGAFSRFGVAAIPAVGGVMGFNALADATQTQMSRDVAARGLFGNATMPDGSTRNVYNESQEWINNYISRVGLNMNDTIPTFQGFMASSMPVLGYEQSRDIFESFSSFGTVRGATTDSMKRAMVAVQQMAAKGKVGAEELRQQMGDAQGFGEMQMLFAQAWQMHTNKTTDPNDPKLKKGSDATAELAKQMELGNVLSADMLPIVAKLAMRIAEPNIAVASQRSEAWRNRATTENTKYAQTFSLNGGDKGFAIIWQTIAELIERSQKHAAVLGAYFQIAAAHASLFALDIRDTIGLLTGNMAEDNIFYKILSVDTLAKMAKVREDISVIIGLFNSSEIDNKILGLKEVITFAVDATRVVTGLIRAVISLTQFDFKAAAGHASESNQALQQLTGFDKLKQKVTEGGLGFLANLTPIGALNKLTTTAATDIRGLTGQGVPNAVPSNTPGASSNNVNNNQTNHTTINNNITVPKVEDIEPALNAAIAAAPQTPYSENMNMGAWPNSGQ